MLGIYLCLGLGLPLGVGEDWSDGVIGGVWVALGFVLGVM